METLFTIGQTGIIGKVTENTGYINELLVQKNENGFNLKFQKFINGDFNEMKNLNIVQKNKPNNLFGIILDYNQNTTSNIELDLRQQSTVASLERIISSLNQNQFLVLFYEKLKQEQYRITQGIYDLLTNKGQNQLIPVNSEMNPYFCYQQVIFGSNKKIICEQQNYIQDSLSLIYKFNDNNDIAQTGYGSNLIPSNKIDFQTRDQQTKLVEITSIKDNYLIFTGQIKKNMNILSGHPDAKIKIEYFDSNNRILDTHYQQKTSAFVYQDLELIQKVNKSAIKIVVTLICDNAITVPGDLILRNFQLYWQPVNYKFVPDSNQNVLTKIQKAGVQTKNYIEQIGFNPRSLEDYIQERNQNANLYRNLVLPVIVEEPIKFFDTIIDDNNKRIVLKSSQNQQQIIFDQINVDYTKQYLVGMWIQQRVNQNIKLQINLSINCKSLKRNSFNRNQDILLDEQNITHNDYKFYYGFIYPSGMKNRTNEDNKNLLSILDNSLAEIQQNHLNGERGLICLENKDYTAQVKLNFRGDQISQIIVMPIFKELQIQSISREQISQVNTYFN